MNAFFRSVMCAFVLVIGIGSASASAEQLNDGRDPDEILAIAKSFGTAVMEKDSLGDPKISGSIDGTKYGIYFYGCKAGKSCQDIQFAAGWSNVKVSLASINEWNRTRRIGKAYLDKINDPMLELWIDVSNGASVKTLENAFSWWRSIIKGFKKDVLKQ